MKAGTRLKKIVVVDDDSETLDLVSAYFKSKNFEVICFTDAKSALSESSYPENSWDILLTDFNFQDVSSIEFTLQIKKSLPKLPIILLSSAELAETALEALQKNSYERLRKPLQFRELQSTIERSLAHVNPVRNLFEQQKNAKSNKTNQTQLIGQSPEFLKVLSLATRVAKSSANIFIFGESGTGKEVLTRYIHNQSCQAKGPFVAINCSAIPENLLESELFGHAKGSFTGAMNKKVGLFEEAQDGTLFLDEIGDLSLCLQTKLLRVLQEKNIKRVGENQYRPINCRIICATHKDLSIEVNEKRFREDLYFRLNVIPLTIPPLRNRKEDLLPLAEFFLHRFAQENGASATTFSKESIRFIFENPWRGNVRELENSIERAVILSTGPEVSLQGFSSLSSGLISKPENDGIQNQKELIDSCPSEDNIFSIHHSDTLPTLEEITQRYIAYAIKKNGGARDKTAKEIGIDRKTLYKRMKMDSEPHRFSQLSFEEVIN